MLTHEESSQRLSFLPETEVEMDEARKWAKFVAIIGFVFSGLMLLAAVFFLVYDMEDINPAWAVFSKLIIVAFYIISAALNFFPSLYLYRFAERARVAIAAKNNNELAQSVNYLKRCFRFIGVLLIVILIIYVLGFIITVAVTLLFSGSVPADFARL